MLLVWKVLVLTIPSFENIYSLETSQFLILSCASQAKTFSLGSEQLMCIIPLPSPHSTSSSLSKVISRSFTLTPPPIDINVNPVY